jgi:hypothetical protein
MAEPFGAALLPRAWQVALGEELFRRSLSSQAVAGRAADVERVARAVAAHLERRGARTHAAVWRHLAARASWLRQEDGAARRDEVEPTRAAG